MRARFALFALLLSSSGAFAQSSPGLTYGQVPTAGQWNSYFGAKQDALGFTPLNQAGGTMLGPLFTFPSSTASSGFNISPGSAPTTPNNGDLWATNVGVFARIGGSTYNLLTGGGSTTVTFPVTAAGTVSSGGIPYFNTNTQLSSSGTLSSGQILQGKGFGNAPATFVLGGDCTFSSPNIACTKTNGTLFSALATAGTPLAFSMGGTGLSSGTSGGLLYFSSSTVLASSGVLGSGLPILGGGAGAAPTTGTLSGNTSKFATANGTLTNGHCVSIDASGNFVDAGGACTTGGGGGTVSSGTANQLTYYAGTGTTVSGNANATISAGALTLGQAASTLGQLKLAGSTSGTAILTPQATSGSPTLTLPNTTGTLADGATSPLSLDATTGNLTCPTCVTSSGGGAISGTAPVAASAAGVVSITGVAGQVLGGASPAFTATPTLGVNATTAGTLGLANGGASGTTTTIRNQNSTGAWFFNLPITAGTAGQVLTSQGGGSNDMTWATVSGTGTVTSVNASSGGIFSFSGGPITTTGTLALGVSGTSGGIPYFSGSTTLSSSAALTANLPVIGGGAGVSPTVGTVSGNTTKFATTTGTLTNGDCVQLDANGNFVGLGAPCGEVLLATYTSGYQDTTHLTSTYKSYRMHLSSIVPSVDGAEVLIEVQKSGTFQSSGYQTACNAQGASGVATCTSSATTGHIPITFNVGTDTSNNVRSLASAGGLSGDCYFDNPSATAFMPIYCDVRYGALAYLIQLHATGMFTTAGAITGIEIAPSSGTLSGTMTIYGKN